MDVGHQRELERFVPAASPPTRSGIGRELASS